MAKVTDLDVLLPPDLEFKRGDTVYTVPGDLSVDTVLELFQLYAELSQTTSAARQQRDQEVAAEINRCLEVLAGGNRSHAQRVKFVRATLEKMLDERSVLAAVSDADADAREISEKVGAALLRVLQIRHPELVELPFGAMGRRIMMQQILANLGVIELDDADPEAGEEENPSRRRARSQRSIS